MVKKCDRITGTLVGQPKLARNKQIFTHYVHPKTDGFIKYVLFLSLDFGRSYARTLRKADSCYKLRNRESKC